MKTPVNIFGIKAEMDLTSAACLFGLCFGIGLATAPSTSLLIPIGTMILGFVWQNVWPIFK